MPRLPRVNYPNAVYHVTARGNGRATIFFEDADRHRFLRQLCDSLEADSVLLYAYVLMDNHFHLLARTPRASLSRFMQRLSTSYALYARYKHGKPGHQFEARFKAKVVEEDTYLLTPIWICNFRQTRLTFRLFRFCVQTAFPGDGTTACAYSIGAACTQKSQPF